MENYIGIKLIKAEPCTVEEFNKTEHPLRYGGDCQEGYKVQYVDSYISWSPKEVFEKAYKKSGELSFEQALYLLKRGKAVTRKGWNGKNMFLSYVTDAEWNPKNRNLVAGWLKLGFIAIKTADDYVVPWQPSQADMLSEDWEEVELYK